MYSPDFQELLVQQFRLETVARGDDKGSLDTRVALTLPPWLATRTTPTSLSMDVSVSGVASLFLCNAPSPVIPMLDKASKAGDGVAAAAVDPASPTAKPSGAAGGGAGAGAGSASVVPTSESTVRDMVAAFKDAVDTVRGIGDFAPVCDLAADEWKKMELGEVGSVADELQVVLASTLFPNNRFTRRRPDYTGPSLSTRGLIRCAWGVREWVLLDGGARAIEHARGLGAACTCGLHAPSPPLVGMPLPVSGTS